ncbi:MAG: hypothetical protein M0Z84_12150 [Gammaproteobacteria bacterium]|nr:hypothetical protein [Gammaproteobacteria bacterium]
MKLVDVVFTHDHNNAPGARWGSQHAAAGGNPTGDAQRYLKREAAFPGAISADKQPYLPGRKPWQNEIDPRGRGGFQESACIH